jgi:hypothetical protein
MSIQLLHTGLPGRTHDCRGEVVHIKKLVVPAEPTLRCVLAAGWSHRESRQAAQACSCFASGGPSMTFAWEAVLYVINTEDPQVELRALPPGTIITYANPTAIRRAHL